MAANLTIEESLTKLKWFMLKRHPFYGHVLLKLDDAKEVADVSTAATDGRKVIYNKEFMDSLSEAEKNFVWMHELYHIILLHAVRRGNRDPYLWNVCCDVLVNDLLSDLQRTFNDEGLQFKVSKDAITMKGVDEITTEVLYERWLKDYQDQKKQAEQALKNMLESGAGSSDDSKDDSQSSSNQGQPKEGKNPFSYEFSYNGQTIKVPANLEIDIQIGNDDNSGKLSDDIKKLLREAKVSSNRGLSGSTPVEELVDKIIGTQINWKAYLKRFLTSALSDEVSYSSPERKYLWRGQIFPGPYEEERVLDEVLFAIDESGSVSESLMQDFIYQINTICNDFDIPADVVFWDTKVTSRQQVEKEKVYNLKVTGTGGTDVDCVYKYIDENKIKPMCLIILTDGYCGVPHTKKLARKTIFVTLDDSHKVKEDLEPYGKVIPAFTY